MTSRDLEETVTLTPDVSTVLRQAATQLNLSPRSYHRLIKVAQTIADLDGAATIDTNHLFEALQYRIKV